MVIAIVSHVSNKFHTQTRAISKALDWMNLICSSTYTICIYLIHRPSITPPTLNLFHSNAVRMQLDRKCRWAIKNTFEPNHFRIVFSIRNTQFYHCHGKCHVRFGYIQMGQMNDKFVNEYGDNFSIFFFVRCSASTPIPLTNLSIPPRCWFIFIHAGVSGAIESVRCRYEVYKPRGLAHRECWRVLNNFPL